jgi:hypothetical protein
LVSIAMEHNGADRARPYVAAAGATFPVLIDEESLTTVAFGFKAIPNGVLVDEAGVVRYAKFGGFSVDKPEDVAAVERFVRGEDAGPNPPLRVPYELGAVMSDRVAASLSRGRQLAARGQTDAAVAEWRAALRLDPENLVIRKQIWAALHPEKFAPTIDWAWQKEQLARERAEEIAAGICGPDGCPIPAAGRP